MGPTRYFTNPKQHKRGASIPVEIGWQISVSPPAPTESRSFKLPCSGPRPTVALIYINRCALRYDVPLRASKAVVCFQGQVQSWTDNGFRIVDKWIFCYMDAQPISQEGYFKSFSSFDDLNAICMT